MIKIPVVERNRQMKARRKTVYDFSDHFGKRPLDDLINDLKDLKKQFRNGELVVDIDADYEGYSVDVTHKFDSLEDDDEYAERIKYEEKRVAAYDKKQIRTKTKLSENAIKEKEERELYKRLKEKEERELYKRLKEKYG